MTHESLENLELGILQRDHGIIPEGFRKAPAGVMLTFVVRDCDDVHEKAKRLGITIHTPPTDMPYGQRRMLLCDPDGTVLDISAPTVTVA